MADAQALNDNLQTELDRLHAEHDERERDICDRHAERERDLTRQIALLTTQSSDADGEWRARHDAIQRRHDAMQSNHDAMRSEHESLRSDHETLQSRHRDLEGDHDTLQERHRDLEDHNHSLQQELSTHQQELDAQQQATDTVRAELAGFVAEVKALSARGDQGWQREEALQRQVRDLEAELSEWKTRYTQSRAAAVNGAGPLAVQPPSDLNQTDPFVRPDGLLAAAHVSAFRLAVDELLRAAHAPQPKGLLAHVKAVVVGVKDVNDDAAQAGGDAAKQRARVAATANNFVTAAQNFAYAPGVSPVSLLDAAASHLAAAVVGLATAVGMRAGEVEGGEHKLAGQVNAAVPAAAQAPAAKHVPVADEEDDDDDGFDVGAYDDDDDDDRGSKYTDLNGDGRSSVSDSVYSLATAVPAGHGRKPSGTGGAQLPRAAYQTPGAAHGRTPSNASAMNGRGGPTAGAGMAGYDLREQDEDIAELKVNHSVHPFLANERPSQGVTHG